MITLDLSCLLDAAKCENRAATRLGSGNTRLHQVVDMKFEVALHLVLKFSVASTPPDHAGKAR